MKIDLVYLWCDGNDAAWREKKLFWQKKYGNMAADVIGDSRFVSHDELKFSLRSVEMYMPWINHIFIVTDGQVPEWLNTDNPKISIVDHKEIMPADALPTFNSNAIEACLHNIPDLSEHFLFANDDMFVARPLEPEFFFAPDGRPYIFLQPQNIYTQSVYMQQIYHVQNLIKEKFGQDYPFEPHHNIDAYRLSDVKKCVQDFKEAFEETAHQRFREEQTMQRSIFGYYALATGNGILVTNKGRKKQHPYWHKTEEKILISKYFGNLKNVQEWVLGKKCSLFCINDNEKLRYDERMWIKWALALLFPTVSSFEKSVPCRHNCKVSIIVPVYNAAKYLNRCLDSLINQTLKDIEIICINDGSDDGSPDILNNYAAKDERIKVLSFTKIGPGGCRNVGIEAAQGEYICFVDADDYVELTTYQTAYDKLKSAKADILSFNALEITKNGIFRKIYFGGGTEKEIRWNDLETRLFNSPFHSWHMVYSREFILSKAIFFADVYWCEDVPFVLFSILAADKIVLIPDCFYYYCRNESSLVSSGGDNRLAVLYIVNLLNYMLNWKKEYAALNKEFDNWVCLHSYFAYTALADRSRHYLCKRLRSLIDKKLYRKFEKRGTEERVVKLFGLPLVKIREFDNVRKILFCGIPVVSIRRKI